MQPSKQAIRLTLMTALAFGGSQAQSITRVDSVLLFHSDANNNTTKGDLVVTKGKVTHTELRPDGSAEVYVFKQQTGNLKVRSKIKGLPGGMTVVPGLAHLRFEPGRGLTTVSEGLFDLNSGLRQPIGYEFLEITGQRRKKDEVPAVLTDDKSGLAYNKVLRESPAALYYPGDIWTTYRYAAPDRRTLSLQTQRHIYDPFSATHSYLPPQTRKVMELSRKPMPLSAAPLVYDSQGEGAARTIIAFRPDDGAFVSLDTLGKVTRTQVVPELRGLQPLAVSAVHSQEGSGMRDIAQALRPVGVDYLLGLSSYEKGATEFRYWLVRLANDGGIVFRHPFQVAGEGYTPGGGPVKLASNAAECVVQLELRKGLLKYLTATVKVKPEGVAYNRILAPGELDEKSITRGRGEDALPGYLSTSNWYLFSLPSGENLLVGQRTDATQWISYGILHLNADGNVKRHYVTGTGDRNPDVRVDRRPGAMLLADGRLLLVAPESTSLTKEALAPYVTLEANLQDGYPAGKQGTWTAGEKNLLFNTSASGNVAEQKGAIGFLDKVSKATDLGTLTARPDREKALTEAMWAPLSAPSVILVDPKAETISRYSLRKTGGYSLPEQPLLYVDAATGRFVYFSRTHPGRGKPRELTDARGRTHFGNGIFLKVVQGTL
jgi:hypothetical protein